MSAVAANAGAMPQAGFRPPNIALTTLGLALVYLGEHYVVDLAAGLALAEGVRRATPAAAPLAQAVSSAIRYLERSARA